MPSARGGAMDIDDVMEWTFRVLLGVCFVMAALVVVMLLVGAVKEVAYQINRRRQQRQRRATTTTPPPAVPPQPRPQSSSSSSSLVKKLLQTIPDVAYQKLPSDDGDSGRESCVICVTPYEAGEPCSVLPACKHLFHKACVAKWLRVRCTCPLCRAAVALLPLPHPAPQGNLNAAESMV